MFKKIIDAVSNPEFDILTLTMLPVIVGLLIIAWSVAFVKMGYIGDRLEGFLVALGLFVWGFSGLPMIIRKEVPLVFMFRVSVIRGWFAIVYGLFTAVGCWVASISYLAAIFRGK